MGLFIRLLCNNKVHKMVPGSIVSRLIFFQGHIDGEDISNKSKGLKSVLMFPVLPTLLDQQFLHNDKIRQNFVRAARYSV